MKKVYAFLMMAVALVACAREEQPRTETPDQPESPTTYTLTIQASKGMDTRALSLDGNTLNAIWDGTEQVLVYLSSNPDQVIATLTPDLNGQTDPASCLLVGDFSQLPVAGNILTLKLNSDKYSDQRGTLAYIADNCDYAVATLHVTGVENGQILSTEGGAEFASQQAIVKFSLKNKAGAAISPTTLAVQVNGAEAATVDEVTANTYTTNDGDGVLFVAIPAVSNGTIFLTASDGENSYTYAKTGISFAAGRYQSITVKMVRTANTSRNLNDESLFKDGLLTVVDGDVLTGTFPTTGDNKQIKIAPGATVTLRDAIIVNDFHYAGLALEGSAQIILEGTNTVSGNTNHAGISISGSTSTLTIVGNGNLTVTGGMNAPGIGCDSAQNETEASCGSITISGGTITANGGSGAAGIGCAYAEPGKTVSCGPITITGGTVTATGGFMAAGIGGGNVGNGATSTCGAITISAPAQVTATRAWSAPYSIGPSTGGHCGTVTIYGHVYLDESVGLYDDILRPQTLQIPFPQN